MIKVANHKLVYEKKYIAKGYTTIAGMDEVGRGPLAGPVTAACVILPLDEIIDGVDDSKKIRKKLIYSLAQEIEQKAISVGVGWVDNKYIDEHNILVATKLAMLRAIENMSIKPEILLVDAVKGLETIIPVESIIRGDSHSYLIGAASIVAKAHRDRFMIEMAKTYPGYGFETNVGYGTKQHRDALQKLGPIPLHRKTFIRSIYYEQQKIRF